MFLVGNCEKQIINNDPTITYSIQTHIIPKYKVSASTSPYTCKLALWRRLELCLSLKRRNSINSEEVCFSWCFFCRGYYNHAILLPPAKTTNNKRKQTPTNAQYLCCSIPLPLRHTLYASYLMFLQHSKLRIC